MAWPHACAAFISDTFSDLLCICLFPSLRAHLVVAAPFLIYNRDYEIKDGSGVELYYN